MWNALTEVWGAHYNSPSRNKQHTIDAQRVLATLKQGRMTMRKYNNSATQIKTDIPSVWDSMLASSFVISITDVSLRLHLISIGSLINEFTYVEDLEVATLIARGSEANIDRDDSDLESEKKAYDEDKEELDYDRFGRKNDKKKREAEREKGR
ncbi:uncharacterized protein H6S33_000019 [Morchella sextelata]|uniref:uncharacterized protein n=1 Tax=Morchella sextelata TaxID=1174677 RepID=UPI001D037CE8|nr:uncharacterized protein H6S33_000019 [Morchella sextelata]KAH0614383.1 hypothetical protein H6S33_000019 [Morchella sextelata]